MVEGRRGLGRGLAALLDEADAAGPVTATAAGAMDIPLENIRPNPDQPRQSFPGGDLEGLAGSIRERGVVQPILVRPAPDHAGGYQIIAGERRWRAAQKAGLSAIPAIVRELSDAQSMEFALIENVQRSDLNALEEARGYATLSGRFARSQEAIAGMVGKSRSHVSNTLRLLKLPRAVQDHLESGRLTAGHART
ncbi:MAG: ParB/RepB/Spo0J family partition protein, partial [Caulobacteraceae bacterium]